MTNSVRSREEHSLTVDKKFRSMNKQVDSLRRLGFFERTVTRTIDFGIGEYYDSPPHILEAAGQAIQAKKTRYPPTQGLKELRDAIAQRAKADAGLELDASNVLITPGSDFTIFLVILAMIKPGDDVIVLDPDYPKFEPNIRLMGANPIRVRLEEDNEKFSLDSKQVEKRITRKTSMIMFTNPGNPTGIVYTKNELSTIAKLAEIHNLTIVTDEMYRTIVFPPNKFTSILTIPGTLNRTLLINGVSKAYDMTGFRVGWLIAGRNTVTSMLTPFWYLASATSSVGQWAALAAVTGPQDHLSKTLEAYQRRRDITVKALRESGLTCTMPQGGTFAFPKISNLNMTSQEVAELFLNEAQVRVIPGHIFGRKGEGHVRLSYTTPNFENLTEGLRRISEVARKRKK